jgi:hypothetical protein
MAKVEAKCGLTLKLFSKEGYEFYRPEIGISDLDTDKSDDLIKADISRAILVSSWVYEAITDQLSVVMEEQSKQISKELSVKK